MCELFAVSANLPVTISMSIEEWVYRGEHNRHGFGFASWLNRKLTVEKEPYSLYDHRSRVIEKMKDHVGNTFLCHVRLATTGAKTELNTHPFKATALDGREFVFAHNGCVDAVKYWPLKSVPSGQTDSEHSFLWLLERLEGVAPDYFAKELKRGADAIRAKGNFNFLMSDGETTYAYADNSLHYLERSSFSGEQCIRLNDAGLTFRLRDIKQAAEIATLIATVPLSDEAGWKRIPRGALLVVRHGRVQDIVDP